MHLTIRMNAARDDVTIDGHRIDRSGMTRSERRTLASMVADTFEAVRNGGRMPRRRRNKRTA